ncbi:DNA polymerase III subunit delta' [Sideroxydans lithotrophicus]|uniref:DNA polymerase III subunit delta' n=1 Tax=Sideroxydans lithotrophicus (strain ES-1) TaxID=580332 RepID=D5CS36_SIDLE|nr:DNA polymerase III subunit delta' [Sideroxydans lithotrophicus]ADE11772.1 DNA polymerase III, delta prime subunit [Sideroxydans lithotrophicus ES-1]
MKPLYPWQSESWQALQGLRNRLPHAVLLKGAQGIGKLDLAMNFAQSLLCEKPNADGTACHTCNSCHWFEQENHPDFRLVQPDALSSADEGDEKQGGKKPSREISVDQIRNLSNFANLSAHCGGYRVVLIHPAESMNNNAANSLLKTLEEPTDNLLFLLISHKPQQLLPTILSRCLGFTVSTPTRELGTAWLEQQGVKNPAHALAQSGFAPLQALGWSESGEGAEERSILLNAIRQPSKMDALALADGLQRSAPIYSIHCLQQWCHDLTSAKLAGMVRYFPEQAGEITKLANGVSSDALLRFQKELLEARRAAYHPLNPKLFLESLLLSYRQLFAI